MIFIYESFSHQPHVFWEGDLYNPFATLVWLRPGLFLGAHGTWKDTLAASALCAGRQDDTREVPGGCGSERRCRKPGCGGLGGDDGPR